MEHVEQSGVEGGTIKKETTIGQHGGSSRRVRNKWKSVEGSGTSRRWNRVEHNREKVDIALVKRGNIK